MKNPKRKARELLQTLKAECTPENFRENYGQDQVRNFRDRLQSSDAPYREKCEALRIVQRVDEITPHN